MEQQIQQLNALRGRARRAVFYLGVLLLGVLVFGLSLGMRYAALMGAVTLAEPDGSAQTLLRAAHRDDAVSLRWAKALSARWNAPVCVRAGIHYDGVTRAQIESILRACDALLETLMERKEALDGHGMECDGDQPDGGACAVPGQMDV